MALAEQDQTQNCPDAGYGAQEVPGIRPVLLGSGDEMSLQSAEARVVVAQQGEVHFEALLDGGIGNPRGHAGAVGLIGHLLPALGQVGLPVRVLDVGREFGPLPRERQATPEPIPGGAHLGRINRGLGEHAATQQHSHLVRSDLVCLALPAWIAFIERARPRTTGLPSWAQRAASQVPGEQAFDGDDEIIALRRSGLEERV
jgi:hypothetical protein